MEQNLRPKDGSIRLPHVSHSRWSSTGIASNSPLRGCESRGKPFGYVELRARIEALLRRSRGRPRRGRIRVGPLEIDAVGREVWLDGARIPLSKKEFALLRLLASEPTRVFTREELLRDVWGFKTPAPTRTIDSHASRLRQKLGVGESRFIVNVWGVGYRLVEAQPQR